MYFLICCSAACGAGKLYFLICSSAACGAGKFYFLICCSAACGSGQFYFLICCSAACGAGLVSPGDGKRGASQRSSSQHNMRDTPPGTPLQYLFSGLWIRIRMDPHYFELLDPDPGGQK